MNYLLRVAFMAAAIFGGTQNALAQQRDSAQAATGRIIGWINDAETGQPIANALVRVLDTRLRAVLTDKDGAFVFRAVPAGVQRLQVEHIAYGRGSHDVNVVGNEFVEMRIKVHPSPVALDSLVVSVNARLSNLEQVGFVRRQRAGWGKYFTGPDADASRIREIIYSTPRMQFGGRFSQTVVVRSRLGRRCVPDIFLDGVEQRWAAGEIESVTAGLDIAAIELYQGMTTPAEFQPRAVVGVPCGAIVIWTHR